MGQIITHSMLIVLALGLVAGGLIPAPAADEVITIHWDDIERIIDQHPALQLAVNELEVAAAEVGVRRQYPNPVLGGGLGRAEAIEGPEEDQIWELELSLPILSLGVYRGSIAAAEAERDAVAHETAALRLEVIRELKSAFWLVVHDQQRVAVLEDTRAQLTSLVDVARVRVEMGEARPMELNRLEIEHARVEVESERAREAARTHRQILNLWLGSRLSGDFRAEADLARLPDIPEVDDAVAVAISRHPEALAAAERIRAASAQLRRERSVRFPEIEIGAFYEKELDAYNYGGRLQLAIPIWNWNSAGIAQAEAEERASERRRELKMLELEAAIRESHTAVLLAFGKAQRFRDIILPKASATAAALEQMYQLGEVDVMNVLDGRRSLFQIQSELLEAYLDSQLTYVQLMTLTGGNSHE